MANSRRHHRVQPKRPGGDLSQGPGSPYNQTTQAQGGDGSAAGSRSQSTSFNVGWQCHLQALAEAYFKLAGRGVQRTDKAKTRSIQLTFLREVLSYTENKENLEGRSDFSGLVIHNEAKSRVAARPVLLDWRSSIGPEGGGISIPLLEPWMDGFRQPESEVSSSSS